MLSEAQKTPDKTKHWAALFGDIFKNDYTNATSGQQWFTGLTDEGEEQYKECLAAVKTTHQDSAKCKFENNPLDLFKPQMDIQCSNCNDDFKRKNCLHPKECITQDTKEELEWDNVEP